MPEPPVPLPDFGPAHDLVKRLWLAGHAYFEMGLRLGRGALTGGLTYPQTSIGCMCLGIELMLKAHVAFESPFLVFSKLSPEQGARLSTHLRNERDFPAERLAVLLSTSEVRTISFDDATQFFEQMFPDDYKRLQPNLRVLRAVRNSAVHFVLPPIQAYELARAAFVGAEIYSVVQRKHEKDWAFRWTKLSDDDKAYAASFAGEKTARLHAKLEEAKRKAVSLRGTVWVLVDGPDVVSETCPVCGNDGIATGETEVNHREQWSGIHLETFSCDECHLALEDSEEIAMAGMEPIHEVTYREPDLEED